MLIRMMNGTLTHNYLIHDINLRQYTITIIILFTVGVWHGLKNPNHFFGRNEG